MNEPLMVLVGSFISEWTFSFFRFVAYNQEKIDVDVYKIKINR